MILTKTKSFKQPKYAEKAFNKLKWIVTFSSVNNIKSRSSTKCMACSYCTDHIPSSDIVASKNVWFFFLNEGISLQYNIRECGEWLLNYALQGSIYNSNSNQLTGGMTILLSLQFSSESFSRVGYLNFHQRLSPPKFPYA